MIHFHWNRVHFIRTATYHILVQFYVLDRLSRVELTHAQVQIDKIWLLRHFVAHFDDAFVLAVILQVEKQLSDYKYLHPAKKAITLNASRGLLNTTIIKSATFVNSTI